MTPKSDEKLPLVELHESEASPSQRSQTTRRQHPLQRRLPGLILVLVLFALFRAAFVVGHHYCPGKHIGPNHTYDDSPSVAGEGKLVNLEAHIMSKCPDAKDCLQMLVLPAMSRVSDKVNFTLSYIGKVDPNSDEVVCMHGGKFSLSQCTCSGSGSSTGAMLRMLSGTETLSHCKSCSHLSFYYTFSAGF